MTFQLRGDTAANWTSANPVLAARQPGYETDTRKLKIGDGTTAWTSLPYFASGIPIADITGLTAALAAKSDTGHTHSYGSLTGLPTLFSGAYGDLTGIPGTFTPSTHSHAIADTTGLTAALAGKSDTGHSHAIADTTGLTAALAGKSDTGHTHSYGSLTGLPTLFSGAYGDLTGIPGTFAPSAHSHAIADTTGLTAALAAKQASAEKGAANGYAALDATGKVPAAQLPASPVLSGTGTITVPHMSFEHEQTITATGVLPTSIVQAWLAHGTDADENSPDMLDLITLSARPGTDQITLSATFSTHTSGPVLINWSAL
jgi:hypothetical protein